MNIIFNTLIPFLKKFSNQNLILNWINSKEYTTSGLLRTEMQYETQLADKLTFLDEGHFLNELEKYKEWCVSMQHFKLI